MKLVILILTFLSFSAFANFAKISEVESGNIKNTFTKESFCGQNCIKIKEKHNSNFDRLKIETYFQGTKRSQIDPCDGFDDCINKMSVKECVYPRVAKRDVENTEIWCNYQEDGKHIETGRKLIVEDSAKKAEYIAAKKAKSDLEKAEKAELELLKSKLENGETLTGPEMAKVLKALLKAK